MKFKSLLLISLMFTPVAHAETVYKTVDDEGNIVFSDSKTEGAEVLEIKEAQTINVPEIRSFKTATLKEKQKTVIYTRLVITSPENDATIHSNAGNVSVGFTLEPALNEKDLMVLFMDEKQVLTGKASEFSLANIDRGTHTVYVAVKDEKDKLLKRSGNVVFHVRRMSILSPNNAPAPEINPPNPAPPNIPGL